MSLNIAAVSQLDSMEAMLEMDMEPIEFSGPWQNAIDHADLSLLAETGETIAPISIDMLLQ